MTDPTDPTDPVFYHLASRALIRLGGAEATPLLDDIVTTGIAALPPGVVRHGALLTPQGRIMFDMLFSHHGGGLIIEVDSTRRAALMGRLKLYRMRRAVEIAALDTPVYAVIGAVIGGVLGDAAGNMLIDPRFPMPAGRFYGPYPYGMGQNPAPAPEDSDASEEAFMRLRWQHGVFEGAGEMPPEKALPLEMRLDLDDGISFDKGCYIGQEVTARTRYRGLVKKTCMSVSLPAFVETPARLIIGGKDGGKDGGDLRTCLPPQSGVRGGVERGAKSGVRGGVESDVTQDMAIGMAVIRLSALAHESPPITTAEGVPVTPLMPPRLLPLPGQD